MLFWMSQTATGASGVKLLRILVWLESVKWNQMVVMAMGGRQAARRKTGRAGQGRTSEKGDRELCYKDV